MYWTLLKITGHNKQPASITCRVSGSGTPSVKPSGRWLNGMSRARATTKLVLRTGISWLLGHEAGISGTAYNIPSAKVPRRASLR